MIDFKSSKFFFEKEKSGLKPNTVREVGENDSRFDELLEMIQTRNYGLIRIHLNNDFDEWFERQITDISYYDERFIISWREK